MTLLIVLLGILSRKINAIPQFIGDALYAVMIYFGSRMLFLNGNNLQQILFPLIICYLIELQQLYNAKWIVEIRNSTLGHYILGQGFLWSDLIAYTIGIVLAYKIDKFKYRKMHP